jgi:hypothetical protein
MYGFRIAYERNIITFVEPAGERIDTHFSDTAKRRKGLRFLHLRAACNQFSILEPINVVDLCVLCDRLLFWAVFILRRRLANV